MSNNISVLFIVGLFLFIIPVLAQIFFFTIPGWVSKIGFAIMIMGIIHTIYLRKTQDNNSIL